MSDLDLMMMAIAIAIIVIIIVMMVYSKKLVVSSYVFHNSSFICEFINYIGTILKVNYKTNGSGSFFFSTTTNYVVDKARNTYIHAYIRVCPCKI